MIKRVSSIPGNMPLFNDLYQREQKERREEKKEELKHPRADSADISPIAYAVHDLLTSPRRELTLKIKQHSMNIHVPETDLWGITRSHMILERIKDRPVAEIPYDEKLKIIAETRYACPALGYLTTVRKGEGFATLDSFDDEGLTQTLRNEANSARGKIRAFSERYSTQ